MSESDPDIAQRSLTRIEHRVVATVLFVLLAALYFLTYSGHEISADELILFDGVHSLAQQGNLWLAYLNNERPVSTYGDNVPVSSLDSEPMQAFAGLPLFWIGRLLPGIGLMQTVWLLNIFVTALTAVVLFFYGLTLGYEARSAFGMALLFGVATMAWPYSKTFFREPIFTLFVLACAYCLERWRQGFASGIFRIGWLIGAAVSLLGALLAKDAALFVIPILIAVGIPPLRRLRIGRRELIVGLGGLLVFAGSVVFALHFVASGRYDVIGRITRLAGQGAQIPYALAGYLLSPGRSWWAFAPVLLLGIWGIVRLRHQKRWREIAVPVIILVVFTVGYAVFQNTDWYGGLAWGPRYLLPIMPFMALLLLPVLDALPKAPRLAQIVFALLVLISIGVQVLGTFIPVNSFYSFLSAENTRLGLPADTINGWQAGTWELNYIPATVLPRLAVSGQIGIDIAWQVNNANGIAILCVIVMAAALILFRAMRVRPVPDTPGQRTNVESLFAPTLLLSLVLVIGIGLYTFRADPRYGGGDSTLHAALDSLNSNIQPGDAVLLNDRAYRPFFMNYYKGAAPIFALPDAPGEVNVPGQPPDITSTNLDALPAPILSMMMSRIALFSRRWWFVTEFIPADTSRTRATEHFLTRHYFPVREVFTANTARVVEFSAKSAPPDSFPPWPSARLLGDQFGHLFTLVGYDPSAPMIKPGQPFTVSLVWRFDGWPTGLTPFDYSVNVSLVDSNGAIVTGAQYAGTPLGTFGKTSQWQADDYYRDNYGLNIPAALPPGTYHLWVLWYDWRNGTRLTVNGADHLDLFSVEVR